MDAFGLTGRRFVHRFSARRALSEMLGKRWVESLVPLLLLGAVLVDFSIATPGLLGAANLATLFRGYASVGLVAIGMTLVLIGGSIDVSVGAIFGLTNMAALIAFKQDGLPVGVVAIVALGLGAVLGSVNGVLVAFAKTRPFITTLVTGALFQSIVLYFEQERSAELSVILRSDPAWTFLAKGSVAGLPTAAAVLVVVGIVAHIVITRTRFGWRLTAVGASSTAARRSGIRVRGITLAAFVLSGTLAGLGGLFQAARLQSSSSTIGSGLEFTVLTAVVLGGVSLAGGRGSVGRALIGAGVIAVITQGFVLKRYDPEALNVVLAIVLLTFATIDLKWSKHRGRLRDKVFVVPGTLDLPLVENSVYDPAAPFALNGRLTGAQPIGLGLVEGPEDVIVDRSGRVYCGDRRGWIWRFSGPDLDHAEVFARVGGLPLGLAFDREGNLVVCVAGMGLYSVDPDGAIARLAAEVAAPWWRFGEERAIRLADDLDIAQDGRIFFSDASTRFDGVEFVFELMEARPNGRVLCYDPRTRTCTTVVKNYAFPNGICVAHDGQSLFICSTALCRIDRLWLHGPKEGTLEPFMENLPACPDNINRASDGTYWVAFAAMRTPAYDLSLRSPKFRRRMVRELPADEWLTPNQNTSCVVNVDEMGRVLDALWDQTFRDHAVITSMREHDGHLYLGGLTNNRVGRVPIRTRTDAPATEMQVVEVTA
ncbi:MAG: SMP-30/gluconolactonase/LRE family protein [Ilumatobacteraceae bacterium]